MRRVVFTSVCTAVLTGICGSASATIVFQDNFENVTGVSPYPDASADADPIAQVGTWNIIESGPSRVQVTTDFLPAGGTRALASQRIGDGASELRANLASASPANPADLVSISFKYKDMVPDNAFGGTVDIIELYGYNDTDANYDQQVFLLRIYKNWGDADDVYVGFGGTGSLGSPDVNGARFINAGDPDDVWNQVNIDMDFVNKRYTMSMNNVAVAGSTNVPFDGDAATANQIQQLMLYHFYGTNTRFAIDDFTVTSVPEPTSMAVLALGGIAAFARRRM